MIEWTESQVDQYGRELEEFVRLGVRWCTLEKRYREQLGSSVNESELRRLLCLYTAKKNTHAESQSC